ncbi:MAG: UvrD-helicase domain-containing protein, partial [Bacteroidales bacterium]
QQTPPLTAAYQYLNQTLSNSLNYWQINEVNYETARVILKNIMAFGLLADIYKQITQLSVDDNLLLISDTARLLKGLVGDSDVPFVYEKIGSLYHSFMIDEFQDTSVEQWKNFRPLIENCLSQDNMAMVVGDVKQSIYRFRNGDWRILAQGIDKDLEKFGKVNRKVLDKNYRSLPSVVNFNNEMLQRCANLLQCQINTTLAQNENLQNREEMKALLQTAYADVEQISQKIDEQKGFVQIEFITKTKEEVLSTKEITLEKIPRLLVQLLQSGYHSRDIAILTRTSLEARSIVDALLINENAELPAFNLISQDALMLNAAPIVQFCISLMRIIAGQKDQVSHAFAAYQLSIYKNQSHFKSFQKRLCQSELDFLQHLSLLALPEMFEKLIQYFSLNQQKKELPFLQALHEHIINFTNRHLSDLSSFLVWWDERKEKLPLQCPEGQDAITVSSIHKSKGLEYKVVILPFASWILDTKTNSDVWFNTNKEPFNGLQTVPIKYTDTLDKTIFAAQRIEEKLQSYVENLNLLYVALTRAREQLYIFAQNTDTKNDINNIAQLLHKACESIMLEDKDDFSFGKLQGVKVTKSQFCFGEQKTTKEVLKNMPQNTISLDNYSSKLQFPQICLRHNPYDVLHGNNLQQKSGTMWHKIFEQIITKQDVEKAIQHHINEGLIKNTEFDQIRIQLMEMLAQPLVADWFSGNWKVYTESSILLPKTIHSKHHFVKRPDRVMVNAEQVLVVDYKFGVQQKDTHSIQLRSYVENLQKMGYSNVHGFVWYVALRQVYAI